MFSGVASAPVSAFIGTDKNPSLLIVKLLLTPLPALVRGKAAETVFECPSLSLEDTSRQFPLSIVGCPSRESCLALQTKS